MTIEEKIQTKIDQEAERAEKYGNSSFHVCDCLGYGWDRDYWDFRDQIAEALRNRGYVVSVSSKWGVTDIVVTKKLNLK